MSRYKQEVAESDGYTQWIQPVEEGYKMCCCDCGLVHKLDFRVNGSRVEFRVMRDNRATGQVRRHMNGGTGG